MLFCSSAARPERLQVSLVEDLLRAVVHSSRYNALMRHVEKVIVVGLFSGRRLHSLPYRDGYFLPTLIQMNDVALIERWQNTIKAALRGPRDVHFNADHSRLYVACKPRSVSGSWLVRTTVHFG
jgi:hypothetical protein